MTGEGGAAQRRISLGEKRKEMKVAVVFGAGLGGGNEGRDGWGWFWGLQIRTWGTNGGEVEEEGWCGLGEMRDRKKKFYD